MYPSQNKRRKRTLTEVDQDDEKDIVSRTDDGHPDVYSRSFSNSHASTEAFRPPSKSSNNMNPNDVPPQHYGPPPSHERSWGPDPYLRGHHDNYDVIDLREDSRQTRELPSAHAGSDWGWYERGQGSSAQAEPWGGGYDESSGWQPPSRRRDHQVDDYYRDERPQGQKRHQNRRNNQHNQHSQHIQHNPHNQQRFTSDNGWKGRQQRNRNNHRNNSRERGVRDDLNVAKEDRTWEPGPSWRDRQEGPSQRIQGDNRNSHKKNGKGQKRGNQVNRQRRERRQEEKEDTLNNWQRRDVHPPPTRAPQTHQKRRQPRSPSPSYSRTASPISSYSRKSSRGRSRSRSFSPGYDQRCDSPYRQQTRSPSERECYSGWPAERREPHLSPNPAYHERAQRQGPCQRRPSPSYSSVSSRSRSRSSSRSAEEHRLPKHRLPQATSIRDVSLSISQANLQPPSATQQGQGEGFVNDVAHSQANGNSHVIPSVDASPTSMLPLSSYRPTSTYPSSFVPTKPPALSPADPKPSFGATKLSFRPISQASSAVKRFFPGEDEEETAIPAPAPTKAPKSPRIVYEREPPKERADGRHQGQVPMFIPAADVVPSVPHAVQGLEVRREAIPLPQSPRKNGHDAHILTDHDHGDATRPPSPSSTNTKELYAIVNQVGEGTFGKVYKAKNVVTKVHVALKRIRMESERDGFPVTAMREIKLLQSLRHNNVVKLYEMMVSNGSVYMVFEYMDHDLTGILSQTQFSFTEANLKSLCGQMLSGLAYLHRKGVVHRDIKGSNILINNRGELKLADFGLARFYHKRRRVDYTNRVITLWYRPPELLFGATVYGPEVDMWSAGCIMLELYTKKPIFQGNDEIHQLDVIYRILGTPNLERWPGVTELPWYELIKPKEAIPDQFRVLFQKWMSPAALDLAEQLLAYDPERRATALQALDTPYFKQELPLAELPSGLMTLEGEWHELETKKERAKKRRRVENAAQQ